ncbi:MAG: peptide methionine sulfoxide reductase [Candidatus Nanosalina sp. J07AB43]|nr:MAG: peptide methionine sulfoxide reductase [Candidatus Nanosalina sp. J07AB43]
MESAVIGGGCFWCTEAAYKQIKAVKKLQVVTQEDKLKIPRTERYAQGRQVTQR